MDGRDFGPPRSVHGPPPPLLSGLAMDSHRVGTAAAGRLPASGLPGPLPPGKYMAGLNLHPHPGEAFLGSFVASGMGPSASSHGSPVPLPSDLSFRSPTPSNLPMVQLWAAHAHEGFSHLPSGLYPSYLHLNHLEPPSSGSPLLSQLGQPSIFDTQKDGFYLPAPGAPGALHSHAPSSRTPGGHSSSAPAKGSSREGPAKERAGRGGEPPPLFGKKDPRRDEPYVCSSQNRDGTSVALKGHSRADGDCGDERTRHREERLLGARLDRDQEKLLRESKELADLARLHPTSCAANGLNPNLMVTGGPSLAGSGRWSADPAAHLATHPWLPRSGSTSMWLAGHPYGLGPPPLHQGMAPAFPPGLGGSLPSAYQFVRDPQSGQLVVIPSDHLPHFAELMERATAPPLWAALYPPGRGPLHHAQQLQLFSQQRFLRQQELLYLQQQAAQALELQRSAQLVWPPQRSRRGGPGSRQGPGFEPQLWHIWLCALGPGADVHAAAHGPGEASAMQSLIKYSGSFTREAVAVRPGGCGKKSPFGGLGTMKPEPAPTTAGAPRAQARLPHPGGPAAGGGRQLKRDPERPESAKAFGREGSGAQGEAEVRHPPVGIAVAVARQKDSGGSGRLGPGLADQERSLSLSNVKDSTPGGCKKKGKEAGSGAALPPPRVAALPPEARAPHTSSPATAKRSKAKAKGKEVKKEGGS
ncbi:trinucleotide repeat-containing gene 18 protein-like [Leptonychotes weddellii]|uniref:Trinucleotide repeat-containing gene 18 protein-like n=1 Tax=Leptonychotes weddellii TaxID=9713 RepID=A0A7F8QVJ2_LEPWE|nr:trinucleotide repeat-containing gene 18 protein-like [Leptonychotes weddellii]